MYHLRICTNGLASSCLNFSIYRVRQKKNKLNSHYNRAQYKFPVPVQLMEVLKVAAVSS